MFRDLLRGGEPLPASGWTIHSLIGVILLTGVIGRPLSFVFGLPAAISAPDAR